MKMQQQIALMLYSIRHELTPSKVLNATRPPGFTPGLQQDSSEFLGHLLESLHAHELQYKKHVNSSTASTSAATSSIILSRNDGDDRAISKINALNAFKRNMNESNANQGNQQQIGSAQFPGREYYLKSANANTDMNANATTTTTQQQQLCDRMDDDEGDDDEEKRNLNENDEEDDFQEDELPATKTEMAGKKAAQSLHPFDAINRKNQEAKGNGSGQGVAEAAVEEEANSKRLSTIEKTFTGLLTTTYKCLTCGWKSRNMDSFRDLQLSFPDVKNDCASNYSVQDLIEYYCSPEKLDGENQYFCDRCKKLSDAERYINVVDAPKNMILTLKHFKYDQKHHMRAKLMHKVFHDEKVTKPQIPNPKS